MGYPSNCVVFPIFICATTNMAMMLNTMQMQTIKVAKWYYENGRNDLPPEDDPPQ
jgi:hypothetical protein